MNKKVYFAGSIRGGRVDAALYQRMIAYIQRTDKVLTEHVGHPELNLLGRRNLPSGYGVAAGERSADRRMHLPLSGGGI